MNHEGWGQYFRGEKARKSTAGSRSTNTTWDGHPFPQCRGSLPGGTRTQPQAQMLSWGEGVLMHDTEK